MNFVTCGQMKILERRANEAGLSYYQMMENAGTCAAQIIALKTGNSVKNKKIIVFCGKGNNGGDGFVAARKLKQWGALVTLVLVDGMPVSRDAVTNYKLIKGLIPTIDMTKTDCPFMEINGRQDVIVDAIYGTGFRGSLNSSALKAAAFINQFHKKALIVALDIPSGLGGDSIRESQIDPNAVCARYTITFHKKKPVHIQAFAKKYCGETVVADIGIREDLLW